MLRTLFSFKGRVSRRTYWVLFIFSFIGMLFAAGVDAKMKDQDTALVSVLFMLIIFWPSLAIQVKRWHDRNKSGWWVLINVVPFIGPLWAIVENGFLKGTAESNRFGENPRQK